MLGKSRTYYLIMRHKRNEIVEKRQSTEIGVGGLGKAFLTMKLMTRTILFHVLRLYILQHILQSVEPLPLEMMRKLREKGFIVVDDGLKEKGLLNNGISKGVVSRQERTGVGKCSFRYAIDRQTSRIPRNLNVAVLKNSANEHECVKLTYEFTVLEECTDCDRNDIHGIIYKLSKQTKVVGFVER